MLLCVKFIEYVFYVYRIEYICKYHIILIKQEVGIYNSIILKLVYCVQKKI